MSEEIKVQILQKKAFTWGIFEGQTVYQSIPIEKIENTEDGWLVYLKEEVPE